ncbi:hypothetical protein BD626DRAFT_478960 [Schizophyllum amplum]|uniref:Uncharacterized protein n=1 Tax=Schizophyllum amplum TaxID=97359 RepID=A0A550CRS4_9AGAR|nr:hypothetical protein BD626DRAFT_478960 [Auriculariopsis ampla]
MTSQDLFPAQVLRYGRLSLHHAAAVPAVGSCPVTSVPLIDYILIWDWKILSVAFAVPSTGAAPCPMCCVPQTCCRPRRRRCRSPCHLRLWQGPGYIICSNELAIESPQSSFTCAFFATRCQNLNCSEMLQSTALFVPTPMSVPRPSENTHWCRGTVWR